MSLTPFTSFCSVHSPYRLRAGLSFFLVRRTKRAGMHTRVTEGAGLVSLASRGFEARRSTLSHARS